MKTYYAEFQSLESIDLWRFQSKKERDAFVQENKEDAKAVTSLYSKAHHKGQFQYWNRK